MVTVSLATDGVSTSLISFYTFCCRQVATRQPACQLASQPACQPASQPTYSKSEPSFSVFHPRPSALATINPVVFGLRPSVGHQKDKQSDVTIFMPQFNNFKLDGASLQDSESPLQRIVVYHYNIPAERVQDRTAYETVQQSVTAEFQSTQQGHVIAPAYFQISAVYVLIHRDTGEERIWQGSFNPRSRDLGQVTPFRRFEADTFVDFALTRSSPERVLQELNSRVEGQESVWSVDRILSIVVCIQTTLRLTHSLFTRRPQLLGYHHHGHGVVEEGRRRRRRAGTKRSVFSVELE